MGGVTSYVKVPYSDPPAKAAQMSFDSKQSKRTSAHLVQLLDTALQPVVHQLPVALDLTDRLQLAGGSDSGTSHPHPKHTGPGIKERSPQLPSELTELRPQNPKATA